MNIHNNGTADQESGGGAATGGRGVKSNTVSGCCRIRQWLKAPKAHGMTTLRRKSRDKGNIGVRLRLTGQGATIL